MSPFRCDCRPRTMGLAWVAGTPCPGPCEGCGPCAERWGEPPAAGVSAVLGHCAWPSLLLRWPRLPLLAVLSSPAASSWLGWGWTAATQLLTRPRAAIPSVLLCPARGAARKGHGVPACRAGQWGSAGSAARPGAQSWVEQLLRPGWGPTGLRSLLPALGGECRDTQQWDWWPLRSCGKNGAGRAQPSWYRMGDELDSPSPCSGHPARGGLVLGVLPRVGGGSAGAALASPLQAGSPLFELGEPWPLMTPSLPLFVARVGFPHALAGLRGAAKPPGSSVGSGGSEGGRGAGQGSGRAAGLRGGFGCCFPPRV